MDSAESSAKEAKLGVGLYHESPVSSHLRLKHDCMNRSGGLDQLCSNVVYLETRHAVLRGQRRSAIDAKYAS